MTTSDKLREIAAKWKLTQADLEIWRAERRIVQTPIPEFLSDLTALISEGYVEKEAYIALENTLARTEANGLELLRQRDELRAIIDRLIVWNKDYPANRIYSTDEAKLLENALTDIVEAAIKNTEK